MDQDEQPKKRVSKTEAKQMGPSYFTRSKVNKRTSNSEEGNSGSESQAQEPPLKKLDKNEQADKSLEISNSTTQDLNHSQFRSDQPSSSVRVTNERSHQRLQLPPDADVDDNPPETEANGESTSTEMALQNEVILESLFSYMNLSDLLTCRVVNKNWQLEGAKELQRRHLITKACFDLNTLARGKRPKNFFYNIWKLLIGCETPFLFSTFKIQLNSRDDLSTVGIRNIFTATTGNYIKKLTLHLDYSSKLISFERSSLMTDLQKLLISHGPNLEFFEINFNLPSSWKMQILEQTDDDTTHTEKAELMLPKLKTFIVTGLTPAKFFADVMNAAVNLTFLGVGVCLYFSEVGVLKYFMETETDGRDKIHLLKDLRLQLHPDSWSGWKDADLNGMENFLTEYKENLKLEAFELKLSFRQHIVAILSRKQLRITSAVIQILESSSETLKKLTVGPVEWFVGLVIPPLPNLQEICFDRGSSSNTGGHYWDDLLPRGINMNHSFPNVSHLTFLSCSIDNMYEYVRNFRITQPSQCVRYIIVKEGGPNFSFDVDIPADFYPIFPNLISISHKYSSNISLKLGKSRIAWKNN